MKNFIELTEKDNGKILVNVYHILDISIDRGETIIWTSVVYGTSAKVFHVTESYEEVKKLIDKL
ncbi:hypothetical protein [Dysgonomonas termitidis]|uniref:Uncharacterized protein n=1 Tax=Dysgonomonas termitidis TaxID=1516126 RepID=A0ABV9L3A4_9BACT